MKYTLEVIFVFFRSFFKSKSGLEIEIENIALRHQIEVLSRSVKRPQLNSGDRMFWIFLCGFWKRWKNVLVIVQPEAVIRWHRNGFKFYWRWKSGRKKRGRPLIDPEIRNLVRKITFANPTWGAPRIHGELIKLGIEISERSISNCMPRIPKKPSQNWKTFLSNHMTNLVSLDFFTVPTAGFRVLFVFVVLNHSRRKVIHFNVTANPTAEWTAQQMIEAFPWDTAPKYLLRDRDSIYGSVFRQRVKSMDINEVLTAPRSPWQNPYVERLIGSIRRECLDHIIVWNEAHLKKILTSYFKYYNHDRTHCGIGKDAPLERHIHAKPDKGSKVIQHPRVGGLHHRYDWEKAA